MAVACAIVASAKNRSAFGWFFLGLFFSLISLIVVIALPSKVEPVQAAPGPTPETHVKCPDCRELVLRDARVCKHCGCRLVPQ